MISGQSGLRRSNSAELAMFAQCTRLINLYTLHTRNLVFSVYSTVLLSRSQCNSDGLHFNL